MTKKIISSVALVAMLGVSAQALDIKREVGVGYASVDIDGTSKGAPSLDIGFKFGETIKQKVGGEFMFISEDANSGSGNIVNFFYNAGLDAYKGITPYVSAGYQFQTFSSTDAADGISYGAGIGYEINDKFSVDFSYKLSTMTLVGGNEYDINIARASVGYSFK